MLIAKLTDENGQQYDYDDHHNDSNEDKAQDYESKFGRATFPTLLHLAILCTIQ